jgi:hypothetical protein
MSFLDRVWDGFLKLLLGVIGMAVHIIDINTDDLKLKWFFDHVKYYFLAYALYAAGAMAIKEDDWVTFTGGHVLQVAALVFGGLNFLQPTMLVASHFGQLRDPAKQRDKVLQYLIYVALVLVLDIAGFAFFQTIKKHNLH